MLIKQKDKPYPHYILEILAGLKVRVIFLVIIVALVSGISSALIVKYTTLPNTIKTIASIFNPLKIVVIVKRSLSGTIFAPDIPDIKIDIEFDDLAKLQTWAATAMRNHSLRTVDHEYVKASVSHKDKTTLARIKLKGSSAKEHFGGKKWSYRVKTKDTSVLGVRSFAIMDPIRRGNIWQFAINMAAKDEGLLTKKYKLVDITLNGEKLGVHVLEESLGTDLLEANLRRDGLILRLTNDHLWAEKAAWQLGPSEWTDYFYTAQLQVDDEDKVFDSPELSQQFHLAGIRFEQFKQGHLAAGKIFNLDLMARFMATTAVFSGWHGAIQFNLVFYLNPLTGLLEPIVDDSYTDRSAYSQRSFIGAKGSYWGFKDKYYIDEFTRLLVNDPVFAQAYIGHLGRVSEESYLTQFIKKHGDSLQKKFSVLWVEDLFANLSWDLLRYNQQQIKEVLSPHAPLNLIFEKATKDLVTLLATPTKTLLPIQVIGLFREPSDNLNYADSCVPFPYCFNNRIFEDNDFVALPIKSESKPFADIVMASGFNKPRNFHSLRFRLNENSPINSLNPDLLESIKKGELNLVYRILGTQKQYSKPIRYRSTGLLLEKQDNWSQAIDTMSELKDLEFLIIDEVSKHIRVKPGHWIIDKTIIFPKNSQIIFLPGSQLKLEKGASVISFGTLNFLGTKSNPVKMYSEKRVGGGLIAFGKENKHLIKNTIFEGLSKTQFQGISSTGAVVFNETNVHLHEVVFKDSFSEDALNIMLCKFLMSNITFLRSQSDALDVDFSTGKIKNISSELSLNDGLDFSGSDVTIRGASIKTAGDKAISAGEASSIRIESFTIDQSIIGLASKDQSLIDASNGVIKNSFHAVSAYQKKEKFGPASITIKSIDFLGSNNDFFLEKGSIVNVDGELVTSEQESIFEQLYGLQNEDLLDFQKKITNQYYVRM